MGAGLNELRYSCRDGVIYCDVIRPTRTATRRTTINPSKHHSINSVQHPTKELFDVHFQVHQFHFTGGFLHHLIHNLSETGVRKVSPFNFDPLVAAHGRWLDTQSQGTISKLLHKWSLRKSKCRRMDSNRMWIACQTRLPCMNPIHHSNYLQHICFKLSRPCIYWVHHFVDHSGKIPSCFFQSSPSIPQSALGSRRWSSPDLFCFGTKRLIDMGALDWNLDDQWPTLKSDDMRESNCKIRL